MNFELPQLDEDGAKKLLAGDYGEQLQRIIASHMSYVTFGLQGSPIAALRKATCFFVKSSVRTFGVTAKHVIGGVNAAKAERPQTICQVGNRLLDIAERQISEGDRADIATFEISEDEVLQMGKIPVTLWPPDPPTNDDSGVLIAGYPAKAVEVVGEQEAIFGIYAATAVAQRVTDWQITMRVEWNNIQDQVQLGRRPPKNFDTGGMSGGPVLSIRNRRGIQSFPLAGVISEGHLETDTFVAERADYIRANGTIR